MSAQTPELFAVVFLRNPDRGAIPGVDGAGVHTRSEIDRENRN
ncbi:hypothetical protein [Nitrosomonas sp. GH22]|nr:hypothetical protein [Nitrosomonas sp. GH22]